jgi:serine/threonine-protein kinase SRPK3
MFIFGTRPFLGFGGIDQLVARMINFVEELPTEWQPKWELMKKNPRHKRKYIPGMF